MGEEGGRGEETRVEEVRSHVAPHRHRLWNERLNSWERDVELSSTYICQYTCHVENFLQ